MKVRFLSWVVSVVMVWLSTSSVFAAEATRGIEIRPKSVVVSLKGSATAVQSGKLGFRHDVPYGERIRTGENSYAGILLGDSAVVVMLDNSEIELSEESRGQVIKLYGGTVRLAVAGSKLASDQVVIVETPSARTVTRGTLAEIEVSAGTKKAGLELGSRNLVRVMAAASQAANVENFNVFEGSMEISTPGNPPVNVTGGQATQVTNGSPGQPVSASGANGFVPEILADQNHGQTPQPLLQSMSNDQMAQAHALGSAIAGEKGSGTTLAEQNQEQIIIASASSSPGTIPPSGPAFFGTGSNLFGSNVGGVNVSGSGILDDSSDEFNDIPSVNVVQTKHTPPGGAGLLLFTDNKLGSTKSNFTATKELLLIDGGSPSASPHGGVAPSSPLIVQGFAAQTNQNLKLQFNNETQDPDVLKTKVVIATVQPASFSFKIVDNQSNPILLDENSDPVPNPAPRSYVDSVVQGDIQLGQESFARIFDVNSNNQLTNISFFSSEVDGAIARDQLLGFGDLDSFLDAQISARSDSDPNLSIADRTITLTGGVVLDQNTQLTIGNTSATVNSGTELHGSVLGLIATNGSDPAFVRAEDSLLRVLNGSSITPAVDKNIALLLLKNSQLIGPTKPTTLTDEQGNPARVDENGNPAIPPIIEVRDSPNSVTAHNAVAVHSTGIVPSVVSAAPGTAVDAALLQASSQIMQIVNSNVTTTSHFANFKGSGSNETLLRANVSINDALVALRNSNLTVTAGHAFNFIDSAGASINGNLASLTNGSKFSILNGAFLNVGSGSTVTLNGSFALFGTGNNQLSVANSFCSPCTLLNGAVPVAGTGIINGVQLTGGTLNLTNGFVPFRSLDGKATNADGSARVNLNLNTSPNTAFLLINGTLNLNPGTGTTAATQVARRQPAAGRVIRR